jgi:hypothetical protein
MTDKDRFGQRWNKTKNLEVNLPSLIGICEDYKKAVQERDISTIENCCYWYTRIRDNAIRDGENIQMFPRKLNFPKELREY